MINLIKNEIIKIFSKKTVYILLIITLIFMILNEVLDIYLNKLSDNMDYYNDTEHVEILKEELGKLDKNNIEQKEEYILYKTQIEQIELGNKYDKNSWQKHVIDSYSYDILENKNMYEDDKESNEYKEAIKKYNSFIKKLDNNEWKEFVKIELDEINELLKEEVNDSKGNKIINYDLEDEKRVLTWRLQKDIPYGNDKLNQALDNWATSRSKLREIEASEKVAKLEYSQKLEKQNVEESIKINEYLIENNLPEKLEIDYNDNITVIASKNDKSLVDFATSTSFFIIVLVIIITGTIVSDEFNKGTIKLLLVKPYNRLKILTSKFIACLIVLLLSLVVIFILQFIVSGMFNGFSNYFGKVFVYNFNTKMLEEIGVLKYTIINTIAIIPQYILLMVFAFMVSILFNNSVMGVALPLLGYMGSDIINMIAQMNKKASFLKYFVTPNWNFRIYLFGRLPVFEPINFVFSLIICIIYLVAMYVIGAIVFNKRDIKNI